MHCVVCKLYLNKSFFKQTALILTSLFWVGLGHCFLAFRVFHAVTLSVFLSHSSAWVYASYLRSALCFSLSPPSLILPLLHSSLPKNSRKFSEALLLQVCSCRELISHQAGGFPASRPASQFSASHSYE